MFGKHWEAATAVVVAVRITGNRPDGTVVSEDIVVDVSPAGGPPFRALAATPRIATDFRAPAVGATVRVEFVRKSQQVRLTKHDPATSRRALLDAAHVSLDDILRQAPGTAPDRAGAAQAQLHGLLDAGVFGHQSASSLDRAATFPR